MLSYTTWLGFDFDRWPGFKFNNMLKWQLYQVLFFIRVFKTPDDDVLKENDRVQIVCNRFV